ncbi:hypothetical protein CRG98_013233 [Punica granatum]|uniref:Myb/SANT-like domain-containing protein n=1 Tax=Punica granatum TaxID=22663 RepID=A0A2I0KD22_PUNGR|nr:hypothetical protein CRG98_013233 [Punica granatum]
MEGSSASVTSQVSKSGKRTWTLAEDAVLVSCMIDLRNMGTHNADTGFKSGYLLELEKMLLEKLSNCGIKVRPHIESRLKTLKREWAIVYDMMLNTSGFGWDSTRKMVTVEDDVWETYVAIIKTSSIYFDTLSLSRISLRNGVGFPCESSTAFYVYVNDELVGSGEYRPKKEIAINKAAKNALEKLCLIILWLMVGPLVIY